MTPSQILDDATPVAESSVAKERTPLRSSVPMRRGSEVYDTILWRVRRQTEGDGANTLIGVGGLGRGMGTSTVAANVALRAADNNLGRVLLVDANLPSPRLHKLFRTKRGPGLAEVLSGKAQVTEVAVDLKMNNLFLLQAGREPDEGAGIEPSMAEQLVSALREDFDFVVIDLGVLKDLNRSVMIARELDGTVLSFRSEAVRRDDATRACESLMLDEVNLIGTVLTRQRRYCPGWLDRFL